MKSKGTKRQNPRRGQVIVLGAAALLVVGIVAAFSIDIGYIVCARTRLQNAADAASLAAAQKIVEERNSGTAEEEARAAATVVAGQFVSANWEEAGWQIAFGILDDGEFVEVDTDQAATMVQVATFRNEEAPGGPLAMFFAPIVGIDTQELTTSASCQVATGIRTIRGGLSPFAVFHEDIMPLGELMVIYDDDKVAPGNCGLLNLDGGANGTDELEEWILNGYDGTVEIDPDLGYLWIEGTPGVRSALKSALEERIGDIILVCVYDQVVEQGSNANYRIIKFVAVTLTDVRLTGKNKHVDGRVERIVYLADCETDDSFDDNLCKIQLVR